MKVGLVEIAIIAFGVGIGSIVAANGEEPGSAKATLYGLFGVIGVVGCPILVVAALVMEYHKTYRGKRRFSKSRVHRARNRRQTSRHWWQC